MDLIPPLAAAYVKLFVLASWKIGDKSNMSNKAKAPSSYCENFSYSYKPGFSTKKQK